MDSNSTGVHSAMAGIELPEEIILQILYRLPVKSLLRFTCVSKQWRFVIKSDLEFAKAQHKLASQHKTLTRRLLCLSHDPEQFVSIDMEMPASSLGDESLYRKVNFPSLQQGCRVTEIGSCNGLVFLVVHVYADYAYKSEFYVCNPSTGFFKQLPSPFSKENAASYSIGVGYVSAIDDYKVLTVYSQEGTRAEAIQIFSLKARCWKRIENHVETGLMGRGHTAALCNEILHWLFHDRRQLFAFDLAKEESKTMPLPDFSPGYDLYNSDIVVSHEGYLSVMLYTVDYCDDSIQSIHFWVMKEYGVHDSWTKLFNLKLSNPDPLHISCIRFRFLVTDCSTFGWTDIQLTRIDPKEEEKHGLALCVFRGHQICVTDYEESLLWIN